MAAGLALLVPMISLATCRHPGSKRAYSRPMLHPGTIPGPPTRAAPMFDTMAPYRLGMTYDMLEISEAPYNRGLNRLTMTSN